MPMRKGEWKIEYSLNSETGYAQGHWYPTAKYYERKQSEREAQHNSPVNMEKVNEGGKSNELPR